MTDIEWCGSLKRGDKLFWSVGDTRHMATVLSIAGNTVLVDLDAQWEMKDGKTAGRNQNRSEFPDKHPMSFSKGELKREGMEWGYRKTADIRIMLSTDPSGRSFSVWGKGDGIGGGLDWMTYEKAHD